MYSHTRSSARRLGVSSTASRSLRSPLLRTSPARSQNARMSCSIVNGPGQFISAMLLEPLSRRFFLVEADLDDQASTRVEVRRGFRDQAVDHREAVRAAIQGDSRFVVAHLRRQAGKFLLKSNRSVASSGANRSPCKNRSRSLILCFAAFRRATPSASSLMSMAVRVALLC